MSLTLIAEYLAAPGQEDRLSTALEAMIEPSLEEPGCRWVRAVLPSTTSRRLPVESKEHSDL
ncbi:putative quinol monooxygenase [Nocardia sp. KC 131]|uniref:putative quinol monooxygenase n=1 Tax=Nocardia arseniciresistens TaxID=3392119 RepID=UPI00398E542D